MEKVLHQMRNEGEREALRQAPSLRQNSVSSQRARCSPPRELILGASRDEPASGCSRRNLENDGISTNDLALITGESSKRVRQPTSVSVRETSRNSEKSVPATGSGPSVFPAEAGINEEILKLHSESAETCKT